MTDKTDENLTDESADLKPLPVTIKKEKEVYDGEESYQYEDLNPSDEELEEDFLGT